MGMRVDTHTNLEMLQVKMWLLKEEMTTVPALNTSTKSGNGHTLWKTSCHFFFLKSVATGH